MFKTNSILELVYAVLKLDWSRDNNQQLKKLIVEAEIDNFDHEFENRLYMMIEKMAQNEIIKQGNAEAANLGVVDLLVLISYIKNQDETGKLFQMASLLFFLIKKD